MKIQDIQKRLPLRLLQAGNRLLQSIRERKNEVFYGWDGNYSILVRDTRIRYATAQISSTGEITSITCDCQEDRAVVPGLLEGLCRHEAALLLLVAERENFIDSMPEQPELVEFPVDFPSLRAQAEALFSEGVTFAKAKNLAASQGFHITKDETDNSGSRHVNADVQTTTYRGIVLDEVQMQLNAEGLASRAFCTCANGETKPVLCAHMAAVLSSLYPAQMAPPAQTDPRIAKLIDHYADEDDQEIEEELDVSVVPYFDGPEDAVRFRIGREKLYVVRNLAQFVSNWSARRQVCFGKELEVMLSPEILTPLSCRYLFWLRLQGPLLNSESFLHLTPDNIDSFFEITEGKKIRLGDVVYDLADDDPKISFSLVAGLYGAFSLTMKEPDFCFYGQGERMYFSIGRRFYRTSLAFRASMGKLIKVSRFETPLILAERDLATFYQVVLQPLSPYITLTMDAAAQAICGAVFPLESKLTVDADEGKIIATLQFHYGKRIRRAFSHRKAEKCDRRNEQRAERLVEKFFPDVDIQNGTASMANTFDNRIRLLCEVLPQLSQRMKVSLNGTLAGLRLAPTPKPKIKVDTNAGMCEVQVDISDYSMEELVSILDAYRRKKQYLQLDDGSILSLRDKTLSKLAELQEAMNITDEQLRTGNIKTPLHRMLLLEKLATETEEGSESAALARTESFREMLRGYEEKLKTPAQLPASLQAQMRPYQEEGFRWMKRLEQYRFGGILADDMGLGKTLQAIALFLSYRESGGKLPILVVCPSSLVYNWESEVRRFAPSLPVVPVTGTAAERSAKTTQGAQQGAVLVTSYDSIKRDAPNTRTILFHFLVLDEAQYIKNAGTQAAKAVKVLQGEVKLALTGTPVENAPAELWSIFDFLMPGYLYTYRRFRDQMEAPILRNDEEALEKLRRMVAPFLLRRLKKDVLKDLPEKTETVLRTQFEEQQKKLYTANAATLVEELRKQLRANGLENGRMQVLSMLTRLRQICCHPPLCCEGSYEGGSAKLELCMELIHSSLAAGHRLLLFSQFTSMLDVIAKILDNEGIAYFTITGQTPPKLRLALVTQYNNGQVPVFLISLKAGGTGLNLTGADIVIHYDPWWNVAAQNQATDRAYRIGQEKNVQVYRLIVEGSIEEKILELQARKAALADILAGTSDVALSKMNADDLLKLLEG